MWASTCRHDGCFMTWRFLPLLHTVSYILSRAPEARQNILDLSFGFLPARQLLKLTTPYDFVSFSLALFLQSTAYRARTVRLLGPSQPLAMVSVVLVV